ncbi:MAG: hypothetical protein ACR2P3_10105 [Geminicoccaceae bacterium]
MSIKRVAVLPWPGIEGAFLCLSGKRKQTEKFGEYWYPMSDHNQERWKFDHDLRTEPFVTFLYDAGDVCAEWDGEYGPIQLWFRKNPDYGYDDAKPIPHWIYGEAYGSGHWSQMAVDEAQLPQRFVDGDYAAIFAELKQWADSRQNEEAA